MALSNETPTYEQKGPATSKRGPLDVTVYDRGLVNRRVHAQSILAEHQAFYQNTSKRSFGGIMVGFVSPWAEKADEMVWRFARKLTHVSPVLYDSLAEGQIRSRIGDQAGRQWLRWLRSAMNSTVDDDSWSTAPKLMPLVSLEHLDLYAFFTGEGAEMRAGRLLVNMQVQPGRART